MSKRFTPQFRTTVLQLLDQNRGDMTLTSMQAGISERTLYDWRRKSTLQQQQQLQPHDLLQSLSSMQQQQNDDDEIDRLRSSMMQTALTIADTLKTNIDSRSLSVRVKALTSLIDRIHKLDQQYGGDDSENGVQTIQIEYVDVDGKVYAAPPWATDDGDEDESEDDDDE